jgi:hypothetical protein
MSTSTVKLELVTRNRRWMAPLPLSAGTPPVDTTVPVPLLSCRLSTVLTVSEPNPVLGLAELIVVDPV